MWNKKITIDTLGLTGRETGSAPERFTVSFSSHSLQCEPFPTSYYVVPERLCRFLCKMNSSKPRWATPCGSHLRIAFQIFSMSYGISMCRKGGTPEAIRGLVEGPVIRCHCCCSNISQHPSCGFIAFSRRPFMRQEIGNTSQHTSLNTIGCRLICCSKFTAIARNT